MSGAFCVMRLGAPHLGHVALIQQMLEAHQESPVLVLVGSADVVGRADAPLPWLERVKLLRALLRMSQIEPLEVLFAPLPELRTNGWDDEWCAYLLKAARGAMYAEPTAYYAGDDYAPETFEALVRAQPGLEVIIVPRVEGRSGSELRRALAGDESLAAKYALELMIYRQYSASQ